MTTHSFRSRAAAVGFAVAVLLGAPVSAVFASPPTARVAPNDGPRIEVTRADVTASNEKIGLAYRALVTMWTAEFSRAGERFVAPRVARYDRTVMTSCGVIGINNAQYCPRANAIFYDEVFVAGMAKRAAMSLGTDGDMAAVGIIAHEMGHAVAMQLGHVSRSSYDNESVADCLAGAFAEQSSKDGSLEKGDIEEAFYGMSLAGDPTPEPTGNVRYDTMVQARIARESHGTKDQRMQNFRTGLDGGPQACLQELAPARR